MAWPRDCPWSRLVTELDRVDSVRRRGGMDEPCVGRQAIRGVALVFRFPRSSSSASFWGRYSLPGCFLWYSPQAFPRPFLAWSCSPTSPLERSTCVPRDDRARPVREFRPEPRRLPSATPDLPIRHRSLASHRALASTSVRARLRDQQLPPLPGTPKPNTVIRRSFCDALASSRPTGRPGRSA